MLKGLPAGEERRDLSLLDAAIAVGPVDSDAPLFTGHAAVFNSRTAIGNPRKGGFYEKVSPGAFSKTLQEADVRHLIDHNSYYVISRMSAGTLGLTQDARGLAAESALDMSISYIRDHVGNLRNKNLTGMSFGFQVVKDEWSESQERDAAGEAYTAEERDIREIKLIEVSSVTFPAYTDTDAGLRYALVPALRHRGDLDAIARAVSFRPELGPLLGYDPELAPVHVDLHMDGRRIQHIVQSTIRENNEKLAGEMLGTDTPIVADAGAMEPFEERDPKAPYGDVTYADPGYQKDGKKRYPLDSAAHCRAAWAYINMPKNAAEYTAEQLASIKSKIKAAAAKFNIDIEQKSSDEPGETTQPLDQAVTATATEPAASTRDFDAEQYQAKAKARALAVRLNLAA